MKVTVGEIVTANPALGRLMRAENLPGNQKFGLTLLVAKLATVLDAYNKVRQEIGLRLSDGAEVLPNDKIEEFDKELEPVHAREHEIDYTPEVSASKVVTGADALLLARGKLVKVIDQPKELKEALEILAELDEANENKPADEETPADGEQGEGD